MIRRDACLCSKAQLDLTSVPPVEASVDEGQWVRFSPLAPPSVSGPIQFTLNNPVNAYLDLAQCYLRVCIKLTKEDGTDTEAADDKVAPINNMLHSLFREVRIQIGHNQLEITPSMGTYPYRAYLETLLSYDARAASTHLTCPGWYKDEHGKMNDRDPTQDQANKGLKARFALTVPTREVELTGRLHCDLFLQDRYLLDAVPLKLEFLRTSDAFYLMCDAQAKYKVHITKAELHMRQVTIRPSVREKHVALLQGGRTVKYPLTRVRVSAHDLPRGGRDFHKDQLIGGQLPKRVVLAFVRNEAYAGKRDLNPFHFHHYDVSSLKLKVNGQEVQGSELKSNFAQGSTELKQLYMELFRNSGQLWKGDPCDLSFTDFQQGFTLWLIDLTGDLGADEGHHYPRQTGNVSVDVQFATALPHPVTLLCYEEYENVLEFDRFRNAVLI